MSWAAYDAAVEAASQKERYLRDQIMKADERIRELEAEVERLRAELLEEKAEVGPGSPDPYDPSGFREAELRGEGEK